MCIFILVIGVRFYFHRFHVIQFSLLFFFESLDFSEKIPNWKENRHCWKLDEPVLHGQQLPFVRIFVRFPHSIPRHFVVQKSHLRTVHALFCKQQCTDRRLLGQNLCQLGQLFEPHHACKMPQYLWVCPIKFRMYQCGIYLHDRSIEPIERLKL